MAERNSAGRWHKDSCGKRLYPEHGNKPIRCEPAHLPHFENKVSLSPLGIEKNQSWLGNQQCPGEPVRCLLGSPGETESAHPTAAWITWDTPGCFPWVESLAPGPVSTLVGTFFHTGGPSGREGEVGWERHSTQAPAGPNRLLTWLSTMCPGTCCQDNL